MLDAWVLPARLAEHSPLCQPPRIKRGQVVTPRRRKQLKPGDRALILGPWGDACLYCGSPADTIDHVFAIARYGSDRRINMRPACGSCNTAKRLSGPVSFMQRLGLTAAEIKDRWHEFRLWECEQARNKIRAWWSANRGPIQSYSNED